MEIGKFKVMFMLSNGQKLVLKCKKFNITKLTATKGKRELSIEKPDKIYSIDLDEIVAVTAKWVLF